jgi:hypothetical protein
VPTPPTPASRWPSARFLKRGERENKEAERLCGSNFVTISQYDFARHAIADLLARRRGLAGGHPNATTSGGGDFDYQISVFGDALSKMSQYRWARQRTLRIAAPVKRAKDGVQ